MKKNLTQKLVGLGVFCALTLGGFAANNAYADPRIALVRTTTLSANYDKEDTIHKTDSIHQEELMIRFEGDFNSFDGELSDRYLATVESVVDKYLLEENRIVEKEKKVEIQGQDIFRTPVEIVKYKTKFFPDENIILTYDWENKWLDVEITKSTVDNIELAERIMRALGIEESEKPPLYKKIKELYENQ